MVTIIDATFRQISKKDFVLSRCVVYRLLGVPICLLKSKYIDFRPSHLKRQTWNLL